MTCEEVNGGSNRLLEGGAGLAEISHRLMQQRLALFELGDLIRISRDDAWHRGIHHALQKLIHLACRC